MLSVNGCEKICEACERKLDHIEHITSQYQKLDLQLSNAHTIRGGIKALWIGFLRFLGFNVKF